MFNDLGGTECAEAMALLIEGELKWKNTFGMKSKG